MDGNQFLAGDGEMGWGWGTRRVDAAPIRPSSAMMMSRARRQSSRQSVEWWGGSVVSVANPFGVGGSGGGVLAPWWLRRSRRRRVGVRGRRVGLRAGRRQRSCASPASSCQSRQDRKAFEGLAKNPVLSERHATLLVLLAPLQTRWPGAGPIRQAARARAASSKSSRNQQENRN